MSGFTITVCSVQKNAGVTYNAQFNLIQLTDRNATSKTLASGTTIGNTTVLSQNEETLDLVFMNSYGMALDPTKITKDDLSIFEVFKVNLEPGVRFYKGDITKKMKESLLQSYYDAKFEEEEASEYELLDTFVDIAGISICLIFGKKVPDGETYDLTIHKFVMFEFGAHMM